MSNNVVLLTERQKRQPEIHEIEDIVIFTTGLGMSMNFLTLMMH